MTRTLLFEGPRAPKRFQLLWAALSSGGDGKERTAAAIRKEARLQDALEAISDPAAVTGNGPATTEPDRALKSEGGTLRLAQEDFELLQLYTEKTPWIPRVARDVVDLWDWLSSADKRD